MTMNLMRSLHQNKLANKLMFKSLPLSLLRKQLKSLSLKKILVMKMKMKSLRKLLFLQ